MSSFQQFDSSSESLIKTPDKNSKLVLDALPSKYDFPALATSLEKVLTDGGYAITGLTGTDNEATVSQDRSNEPVPVDMPFSLGVIGPYDLVKNVVNDLERSIRPITVDLLEVTGTSTETRVSIQARTYYQPGRSIYYNTKEVK